MAIGPFIPKQKIAKKIIEETTEKAIDETVQVVGPTDVVATTAKQEADKASVIENTVEQSQDLEQAKKADPNIDEPVVTIEEESVIKGNQEPPTSPPPPPPSGTDQPTPTTMKILFDKEGGVVPDVKKTTPKKFLYTEENISRITDELTDEDLIKMLEVPEKEAMEITNILKEANIPLPKNFESDNLANVIVTSVPKADMKKINTMEDWNAYYEYAFKEIDKAFQKTGIKVGKVKKSIREVVDEANEVPQSEATRAALARPEGISFLNAADLVRMQLVKQEAFKRTQIEAVKLKSLYKKLDRANDPDIEKLYLEQKQTYAKSVAAFNHIAHTTEKSESELGRMMQLLGNLNKIWQGSKTKNIQNILRKELNGDNLVEHASLFLQASAKKKKATKFLSLTMEDLVESKYGVRAFSGAWIQSLLGSVHMHINNFVENFVNSNLLFMFETIPGALVGNAKNLSLKAFKSTPWTRNLFKNQKDYAQFRDFNISLHAEVHSFGNAVRNLKDTFVKNRPIDPITKLYQSEREIFKPNIDPDVLAKTPKWKKSLDRFIYVASNMAGRAMTSADEFFATKTFNRESLIKVAREVDDMMMKTGDVEKAKIYAKQRMTDFDAEFADEILRTTRKSVYKDEGKLENPVALERGIEALAKWGNNPLVKTQIPFQKVYLNIMGQTFKRTPAAPLVPSFWRDMKRGGRHADMAIGRMLTGTAITMYGAYLSSGLFRDDRNLIVVGHIPEITNIGDLPYKVNAEQARKMKANFTNIGIDKPMTIYKKKEGELNWNNAEKISLRKLGLFGNLLAVGADYNMCMQNTSDLGALTKMAYCYSMALYDGLTDLPYTDFGSTILDFAYIRDSDELWDKFTAKAIELTAKPITQSLLMVGTGGLANTGFLNSIDRIWDEAFNETGPRDYTVNNYDTSEFWGDSTEIAFKKALQYTINTFEIMPWVDEQTRKRDRFGRPFDRDKISLSYDYTEKVDLTPENDRVSRQLHDDNIATYYDAPYDIQGVTLTANERSIYHYFFTTERIELINRKTGKPFFPGKGGMTWYDTLDELFNGSSQISQIYKDAPVLSMKDENKKNLTVSRNTIVEIIEQEFTREVQEKVLEYSETLGPRILEKK